MLSILVCHSYFLQLDQKQVARAKPYPPLATLQVVNLLRQAGHQVSFFDAMLADGVDEYDRQLQSHRPQVALFYEDNFNFLSKMCLATMRRAARRMIGAARDAGARVIVAGPDVTDAPQTYLSAGAEFALVGEGLSTLLDILPRMDACSSVATEDAVRGLSAVATQRQGKLVGTMDATGGRAMLLPTVGMAAWDLVDMEHYRRVWTQAHGYFSLNMAASRGCSFRCSWCSKPTWGNRYLQRTAADVAEEMAYLRRTYKPDHVWFADDIFGFKAEWVSEFAAATRVSDAQIPFTIQTRADLISESMARALADSGCCEAWIGAESGSQRVLDGMNKGTTVQEILTARTRLRAVGIRVGFFIQLGYLNEELEDIIATRDLLAQARPDDIGVSVSYPLPGTKFYDLVKAQMRGKTHWQESDDLEMMFEGTYTSDFYRSVRNLLHVQVALQSDAAAADSVQVQALAKDWRNLLDSEMRHRTKPTRHVVDAAFSHS